jgi:hypothetical protein
VTTLSELYVIEFPCGAFRCLRTYDVAVDLATVMAKEQSCCLKGHSTFEVYVFAKSARVASCYAPPRARRGALRLVKS